MSLQNKIQSYRKFLPYLLGALGTTAVIFHFLYSYGYIDAELLLASKNRKNLRSITQQPLPYRDTTSAATQRVQDLSNKQTLEDIDVRDKRVQQRTDYNVVINQNGTIQDTSRIDRTIPTLLYLQENQVKCIVIITHRGRPAGTFIREDYSLQPVVYYQQEIQPKGTPIEFLPDCIGASNVRKTMRCQPGTVFQCENQRFHIEEVGTGIIDNKKVIASEDSIQKFAQQLSRLGDVYVFEAYGAAHRPHCSIVGIQIPIRVAGLYMAVEMHAYSTVLSRCRGKNSIGERFVAIVGSAMKIADKISVLEHLLGIIDDMIITGGMAFTFKSVIEHDCKVGSNMIDLQAISDVERLIKLANKNHVNIHIPTDHLIAENLDPEASIGYATDELGMPPGWIPQDIGMETRAKFSSIIRSAHTVLWVGTVGCFEWGPFSGGTLSILRDIIEVTKKGAYTLIAGGDAAIAARRFIIGRAQAAEQVSFVSSGGGSSLVLLEGKSLYGAERLRRNDTVADSSQTDITGSIYSNSASDVESNSIISTTKIDDQELSKESTSPILNSTIKSDDNVSPLYKNSLSNECDTAKQQYIQNRYSIPQDSTKLSNTRRTP